MVGRTLDWQDELGRWLKPFLDRLGHKARRRMCLSISTEFRSNPNAAYFLVHPRRRPTLCEKFDHWYATDYLPSARRAL
jgi:hypothetical protein